MNNAAILAKQARPVLIGIAFCLQMREMPTCPARSFSVLKPLESTP
jgi:hypothetical protein